MISATPLVSVICLSYNHERFLEESLKSVLAQTYQNIEIIVVDDASTDGSQVLIESFQKKFSLIKFIKHIANIGNCKSFNQALALSSGKYIIDFATDDVMMPDRIEKQVQTFENLGPNYGVMYTDAFLIDEYSNETGSHYEQPLFKGFNPPSENVYKTVLERYFINPPTIMFRREVIEKLGGYDESLAYEDFDFWVRSARLYDYYYLNERLTKRRIVSNSLSARFQSPAYALMFETTYKVCLKALWLNKTEDENKALAKRIEYEMTQAFLKKQKELVKKYFALLKNMRRRSAKAYLVYLTGFINL